MSAAVTVLSHIPITLLGKLLKRFPTVEVVQIPESEPLAPGVRGEVLLTQTWAAPNFGAVMGRGVRWVHAYGTGVNRFPFAALGDAQLTCSRGSSGIPIAEWVLAAMLAFEKRIPASFVHEPAAWKYSELGGLYGRTLALVGFGGIGRDSLAHVKRGAHLVNVSRGALVDQEALREALDDGRIACASLDVAEPEPPPAGHWLYTHPRVRLSPHISWNMPGALDILLEPFLENLARWQAGKPLLARDLVDRERGY